MPSESSGSRNPEGNPIWGFPDSPAAPALEGNVCADVAIVGGGFAGLSCARYLKQAEPSWDIVLLDRERIGSGASGRNAGFLSPFLPLSWLIDCSRNPSRLEDIRFAAHFIAGEIREFLELVRREQIACDLHPLAMLIAGTGHFHRRLLRLIGERVFLTGLPARPATASELEAAFIPSAGAGYVLQGHALQPLALAEGLKLHVRKLGVRVFENSRVARIVPDKAGSCIVTGSGARLVARKAILATNAYTGQIELDSRPAIPRPTFTYLLATEPLSGRALESLPSPGQAVAAIGGEYFYARSYQNRLLFGGIDLPAASSEPDARRDEGAFGRLQLGMIRRFPSLAGCAVDGLWGGPYHETRAGVPLIRPLPGMPGVILNIGYGGVGVTLTQFSGRLAARLILGDRRRDRDADRMIALYQTTRIPIREGLKLGLRLLGSSLTFR